MESRKGAKIKAMPIQRRKQKQVGVPAPKRLITLRINPEHLTEDELDYLYYLKHKNDPNITFDELLNKLGYEVVAKSKKKR